LSELLAIGVSHKTAPVEVRERLALPEARAAEFVRELRGAAAVQEAVAVSTCNRTELYLVVGDPVEAESTALAMLARQAGIRPTGLATAIYSHHNCDAARHLYRVVAGLESMIVGEAEIQGQVKRAYETALRLDTTGPLINRLFNAALATGKRVRSETAIGERPLSLPAVAVALAREQLGDVAGREVVILGTGETSELTARALADSGTRSVFVANRRRDRALSLARRYGGRTLSFDELPEALVSADIVVAATASPHLLLEASAVEAVMRERGGRPVLLIDLAVPRDIDGACAELPGVALHDIDDLQAVADRNRRVRQAEARKAEGILEEEIQHFAAWLGSLEVLPTVASLRSHGTAVARQVVDENKGKWETASPRDLERIDALAAAVVSRLLHEPTVRMKEMHDDRVHARMALVRDLFGLSADDAAPAPLAEVRELSSRQAARDKRRS
jgi:glutamyl-tRNA reductase